MAIGDPYISAGELKAVLGISSNEEDALITRALAAATRAIDNMSGYSSFWKTGTAQTRTIDCEGRILPKRGRFQYAKLLLPDPIATLTGFAVPYYPSASCLPSDCFARGEPAFALKLPLTAATASDTISVTAYWGFPEVPADIVMACQMQAQRYYKRRGSPEGIAGNAEWGMMRIPKLDPDVVAIMQNGGYVTPGIG